MGDSVVIFDELEQLQQVKRFLERKKKVPQKIYNINDSLYGISDERFGCIATSMSEWKILFKLEWVCSNRPFLEISLAAI